MAGLRDILSRLKSVKNTRKITYAMKLVSTAKLKKAQESILNFRTYNDCLTELLKTLGIHSKSSSLNHPLMEKRNNKSVLLIVISSSRGLAGGYNANLIKGFESAYKDIKKSLPKDNFKIDSILLGKKAVEYFKRTKRSFIDSYESLPDDVYQWPINELSKSIEEKFINESYDEVHIIYTRFKSALSMTVCCDKILPVDSIISDHTVNTNDLFNESDLEEKKLITNTSSNVLLEPSINEVFSSLIPKILKALVFKAFLDAKASEHASRMTAMDSATKNAGDLIDSLQLKYNKLRQSRITAELLDIVGGAEAS